MHQNLSQARAGHVAYVGLRYDDYSQPTLVSDMARGEEAFSCHHFEIASHSSRSSLMSKSCPASAKLATPSLFTRYPLPVALGTRRPAP